jgi:hypothetical protein
MTGGEGAEPRLIARIWATVDLDRAARDLGLPVQPLAPEPHLGAAVGLVRPPGEPPIALLEPDTEGRLAATLARHGEGLAGAYLMAGRSLAGESGVQDGPFGPSVLDRGSPRDGPHLILVDPAAVPSEP